MEGFENNSQDSAYNDNRQGSGVKKFIHELEPMKRRKRTKNYKKKKISAIIAIAIFLYFFLIRPAYKVTTGVGELKSSGKALKAAFQKNDMNLVQKELDSFSKKYNSFEKEARMLYWAFFIPYVNDFRNGIGAGHYLLEAGKESVSAITPYADLIGFKKGESSFSEKSGEDRLQTVVFTLDKIMGRIDTISDNVKKAEDHINKISPNFYPEKLGKTHIRSRIVNVKEQIGSISTLFVDAKPLFKKLPEILGKGKEKTYLILFQNQYERRATGGFLTSYAFFRIKDGKMRIERSEDIYSLDLSIANHPKAPDEILKYHKGVNQFYIRDSNLSPDFVRSIDLFENLYKLSGNRVEYDGIISLDAKVLVDMLTIFGDTEVDGMLFSARQDARCDCPQVIYQLFDLVDRPVNYTKTNRKGILGDLMFALFNKALSFSPSKYWGTFSQTMYSNLEQKHILLNFNESNLQESVEKVNFAGRIRSSEGDFLHVNNVNFAGAKSNLFISEMIDSKTTVDRSSGKIKREVVLEYKNPYPHSDCNLERGGLCLNATLRNWLRVFVPKGSKLISFDGSRTDVKTYDDLGKTVFEGFMTVDPKSKSKVTIIYLLPETISPKKYVLLMQKQPGVEKEKQSIKVSVNGKTVYDNVFDKDHIFEQPL